VDVDTLTSAVVPLSKGAEWFEKLRSGFMKVIVEPTKGSFS
jgi:hypothetical protein